MFRHGDRNPDEGSLIPNSTYYDESYYPEGYGQLTDVSDFSILLQKVKEIKFTERKKNGVQNWGAFTPEVQRLPG